MKYCEKSVTKVNLQFNEAEQELLLKAAMLIGAVADKAQSPPHFRDDHLLKICNDAIMNLQEIRTYTNEIIH